MRCPRILACVLLAAAAPVHAQPAEAPPTLLGYAALPGGFRVASAETLGAGTLAFGAIGGFGYRRELLADDHRFGRGRGDLAFAYAPTTNLTLALSLDGRYDKHYGLAPSGDDGYVGDPRVFARFGTGTFGAQLTLWVPGKDAPSVAASAISVEARALASLPAGPGLLSLNAGFRLDNSAKSIDDAAALTLQDQVSLGVSEFHAIVGGAHYGVRAGARGFVGVEGSIERFIGSGAPGQILRGTLHGGLFVTPRWSVLAYVETASVPAVERMDAEGTAITLIPFEPTITGGLALHGRFGGGASSSTVIRNERPQTIEVIEYADLAGTVVDETKKPVVGARVTVTLKNHTGTAVTDETGAFTVPRLPIGRTREGQTTLDDTAAEIAVAVDGKKPATQTLTLAKGANTVTPLTLEPMLPPGQLRAVVTAGTTGKPLADATVTIEPGGQTATSGPDGKLQLDLPPGAYKATATAPGFKPQTLDVTIDTNGVSLKNFELRK